MPELHFGGPDRPACALRDLLQEKIEAVPPGGEISWCTYYFRDRRLAYALTAASDRGVRVVLHLEGRPRLRSASRPVLEMLTGHGLGGGLVVHRPGRLLQKLHPHLHAKVYAFSHPRPHAMVGSFNPSGDRPEDAAVIAEIGDQDRGHNLLVELSDPVLVEALFGYVGSLNGLGDRFRTGRSVRSGGTALHFYPRLRTGIIDRHVAQLGKGARVRGAVSHLKSGNLAGHLAKAARRGASVELLVHDTERRVPQASIASLESAGVSVRRYSLPHGLPLHAKFLLTEGRTGQTAWFGSFNFNPRSRYLNHELLVESAEAAIYDALNLRFEAIAGELGGVRLNSG